VAGSSLTSSISVTDTILTLTLRDLSIETGEPLLCANSTVSIVLVGNNTLVARDANSPGIHCSSASNITLRSASDGILFTAGGPSAAGIGAGGTSCHSVVISGAGVRARGGTFGAGIGSSGGLSSIDRLAIFNSTVFSEAVNGPAIGGSGIGFLSIVNSTINARSVSGAGIGSDGIAVVIQNSTVDANAESGAAISSASNLEIADSIVTARALDGYGVSASKMTIASSTLNASSLTKESIGGGLELVLEGPVSLICDCGTQTATNLSSVIFKNASVRAVTNAQRLFSASPTLLSDFTFSVGYRSPTNGFTELFENGIFCQIHDLELSPPGFWALKFQTTNSARVVSLHSSRIRSILLSLQQAGAYTITASSDFSTVVLESSDHRSIFPISSHTVLPQLIAENPLNASDYFAETSGFDPTVAFDSTTSVPPSTPEPSLSPTPGPSFSPTPDFSTTAIALIIAGFLVVVIILGAIAIWCVVVRPQRVDRMETLVSLTAYG
jgi:hypothetical protein